MTATPTAGTAAACNARKDLLSENVPLADVIKEHNMSYHFYADDTQIYMSFQPSSCIVTLDEVRSKIKLVSLILMNG